MNGLIERRTRMQAIGKSVFYDRLVFDGTAWIQTDLFIPSNGSIDIDACGYETQKVAQNVFKLSLSVDDNMVTAIWVNTNTNSSTRQVSWRYTSTSTQRRASYTWSGTPQINFWMTPKRAAAGNSIGSITAGSNTPSIAMMIGGPATSTITCFTGRTGIWRIFDSDAQNATSRTGLLAFTPVYTLRPCTYNGEAGLWCVETNKFYGNSAGSGQLTVLNL